MNEELEKLLEYARNPPSGGNNYFGSHHGKKALMQCAEAITTLAAENAKLVERVRVLEEALVIANAPTCFSCGVKVTQACPRGGDDPCGRVHLGGTRAALENRNDI